MLYWHMGVLSKGTALHVCYTGGIAKHGPELRANKKMREGQRVQWYEVGQDQRPQNPIQKHEITRQWGKGVPEEGCP
jgi:hypothetical protein